MQSCFDSLAVQVMGSRTPAPVADMENEFWGGSHYNKSCCVFPSCMTEMTYKKGVVVAVLSSTTSSPHFILQEKYESAACVNGRLWQL